MSTAYEEIREFLSEIQVIDTHEHLPPVESARDTNTDVLKEYLQHYFSCDLVSAGLPPDDLERVRRMDDGIETKWSLVAPYWEVARHTGYGRALDIAARRLYDVDRVDGHTIGELNEKFQRTLDGGWYQHVLKDTCRIKTSIESLGREDLDPAFFRRSYNPPVFPTSADDLRALERRTGVRILSMEDWKQAVREDIAAIVAKDAVSLKIGCAYERPLRFEDVPAAEAEKEWCALLRDENMKLREPMRFLSTKTLQDHLYHHVFRVADDLGLVVQIHTGIQEGNGNFLANSDPILLNNLFLKYGNVTFDIFHIGYPFQHKLSTLAKNFSNVNIDMCWVHIISPEASVRALVEFLDAVPANKISAFGGDYVLVDGVVGHLEIAKDNVARALAKKVRLGIFDVPRACEIGKMLFHDNPARIFGIK